MGSMGVVLCSISRKNRVFQPTGNQMLYSKYDTETLLQMASVAQSERDEIDDYYAHTYPLPASVACCLNGRLSELDFHLHQISVAVKSRKGENPSS